MEDLVDVGNKVIETIKRHKPADAGDLALGIGKIIDELREEQSPAKLNHLEGLFKELAYGEEYVFRVEPPEVEEDLFKNSTLNNPFGGIIASGVPTPALSGACPQPPIPLGAIHGGGPSVNPNARQQLGGPISGPTRVDEFTRREEFTNQNPCGEVPLAGNPCRSSLPTLEEVKAEELRVELKEVLKKSKRPGWGQRWCQWIN